MPIHNKYSISACAHISHPLQMQRTTMMTKKKHTTSERRIDTSTSASTLSAHTLWFVCLHLRSAVFRFPLVRLRCSSVGMNWEVQERKHSTNIDWYFYLVFIVNAWRHIKSFRSNANSTQIGSHHSRQYSTLIFISAAGTKGTHTLTLNWSCWNIPAVSVHSSPSSLAVQSRFPFSVVICANRSTRLKCVKLAMGHRRLANESFIASKLKYRLNQNLPCIPRMWMLRNESQPLVRRTLYTVDSSANEKRPSERMNKIDFIN